MKSKGFFKSLWENIRLEYSYLAISRRMFLLPVLLISILTTYVLGEVGRMPPGLILVCIVGDVLAVALLPFWMAFSEAMSKYGDPDMETIDRYPGYYACSFSPFERFFEYWIFKVKRLFRINGMHQVEERIIASANVDRYFTVWIVLRPGRHHHVISHMAEYGRNKKMRQQGFFTNHYRYIDREVARALAMKNGQCPEPFHGRELFSEDLWDTPEHLKHKG